VAERGTHDELIRADRGYARLFRLQAAGYRDPGRPAAAWTATE
jgi:ATP-binding cassette subfamily B protein